MTFDDVLEKISNLQGSAGYASGGDVVTPIFSPLEVNDLLEGIAEMVEELREEYAPEVPLEARQIEFLSDNAKHVVEAVADFDADWEISSPFDDRFFNGLTEEQVVSAWLHPETIKVVDK